MPVPDKHAAEPTQEIQLGLYRRWVEVRAAAAAWAEEEKKVRADLELALAGASAGTVEGRKVVTFRPTVRVATKRLMEDYPALVEHYMVDTVVSEFDLATFTRVHRDIVDKYRVHSLRLVEQSSVDYQEEEQQ